MTNYLGEEVQPRKLSFSWNCPHLDVLIDGHWRGMISPNGWQGHTMNIHHKFGEPVMNNLHLWPEMSLAEMNLIHKEWDSHIDGFRAQLICVGQVAARKKISFADALDLLKKKIPMSVPDMTVKDATDYCRIHGIPWQDEDK